MATTAETALGNGKDFQRLGHKDLLVAQCSLLAQLLNTTVTETVVNNLLSNGRPFQDCSLKELQVCKCELLYEILTA